MPNRNGRRGTVLARDANGELAQVSVLWERGSTYLSYRGRKHLVHKSNLRRENGFALEAMLLYGLTDAVYYPN